jgi:hypothetical protein
LPRSTSPAALAGCETPSVTDSNTTIRISFFMIAFDALDGSESALKPTEVIAMAQAW